GWRLEGCHQASHGKGEATCRRREVEAEKEAAPHRIGSRVLARYVIHAVALAHPFHSGHTVCAKYILPMFIVGRRSTRHGPRRRPHLRLARERTHGSTQDRASRRYARFARR